LYEAVLDDAEEFGLNAQGKFRNFVEKESSAVGSLKDACLVCRGTRECASGMTEQVGFSKGFGNCSAVDGDKRPRTARAKSMDEVAEALLARAGFTCEQDGEGRFGGDCGLLRSIAKASGTHVEIEFEEGIVEGRKTRVAAIFKAKAIFQLCSGFVIESFFRLVLTSYKSE